MSNTQALASINPFAKDGQGQNLSDVVSEILNNEFGTENTIIASKPIPDEKERLEYLMDLIKTKRPEFVFAGGGDGTILEVATALLMAESGIPTSLEELLALRVPDSVKYLQGIGLGSAQDIKATLGFSGAEDLQSFIKQENRNVFDMGVTWLVQESPDAFHATLVNHSLSIGLMSHVFDLREQKLEEWKKRPENKDKPVPRHLSTIEGRMLQTPNAVLEFLREHRAQGLTVQIKKENGEIITLPNTGVFGIINLPVVAANFAMPLANSLAGDHFQTLVAAIPAGWQGALLSIESFIRARLAKTFKMTSILGADKNFLTISLLNYLGLWDPNRAFTLTHGESIEVTVYHKSSQGIAEPYEAKGNANGDLGEKMHEFKIVVGPKKQKLPMLGTKSSIAASMQKRTEFSSTEKNARRLLLKHIESQNLPKYADQVRNTTPSRWRRFEKRVIVSNTDPIFPDAALSYMQYRNMTSPFSGIGKL